MEEETQTFPSLPPNFVSLQKLQEQRAKEQDEKRKKEEEEEERRLVEEKRLEEETQQLVRKEEEIKSNKFNGFYKKKFYRERRREVGSKSQEQESEITPKGAIDHVESTKDLAERKKKKKQKKRKSKVKHIIAESENVVQNGIESMEEKPPSMNQTVEIEVVGDDNKEKLKSDEENEVNGDRQNGCRRSLQGRKKPPFRDPRAEIVQRIAEIRVIDARSTVRKNGGGGRRVWNERINASGRGGDENLVWVKKEEIHKKSDGGDGV